MAIALALSAMLCWSITLILAKPGLIRMNVAPYGFIRPLFASVLVFFFGLATSSLAMPAPSVLAVAALGGFLDMFIGVALFLDAIKRLPTTRPVRSPTPLHCGVLSPR